MRANKGETGMTEASYSVMPSEQKKIKYNSLWFAQCAFHHVTLNCVYRASVGIYSMNIVCVVNMLLWASNTCRDHTNVHASC